MFSNQNGYSLADIAAATGNNGNNGFFGNDGWWIILLFLFAGWGGYGGGLFGGNCATGSGITDGYILTSDFANIERKMDSLANGMCDGFYTTAQQINGVNTNILTASNSLQAAIKDCCCQTQQNLADVKYTICSTSADTNYNIANQANGITNAIQSGFCQTNFNAQTNARDIIDSQSAGTRAILDKLCQMEANAKDEKIAELTAKNSDLRLAASQAAQNAYLVNELRPCPSPAYVVPNPYCCNCNCNQYGYGTTIA